jgi:hypothetical protein
LKRSSKIALVVAGYVVAVLVAAMVINIYVTATDTPDRQTYGGMFAFGDSLVFLAAFGLAAIPATGAALFFLRPVHSFWRVLSIAALTLAATGLVVLADHLMSPNAAAGSLLGSWSVLSPLRVFAAPILGIVFFLSFLFAPARVPRIVLFTAAAIETIVFVWVAFLWFSQHQEAPIFHLGKRVANFLIETPERSNDKLLP